MKTMMNFNFNAKINRADMEKLLTSDNYEDYIKVTEMFLGPAPKEFVFVPKHKSYVKM